MKYFNKLTKIQFGIFALLVCGSGVLGYLFYENHRANIHDKEIIKQTKEENLDLSQDLSIVKDKYDRLQKEVTGLKNKVSKVSFKKTKNKKKYRLSAGRNSKYKHHYKRFKTNYKKLYFQLKNKCEKKYRSSVRSYKRR